MWVEASLCAQQELRSVITLVQGNQAVFFGSRCFKQLVIKQVANRPPRLGCALFAVLQGGSACVGA